MLPTSEEMCLNVGLYDSFDIEKTDLIDLRDMLYGGRTMDCYCLECKKFSTFITHDGRPEGGGVFSLLYNTISGLDSLDNIYPALETASNTPHFHFKNFYCTRNREHMLKYVFMVKDMKLSKIGQNPSVADLNTFDIKKYRNILKDKYSEFNKGIGLASHGIGIGSFVYLRRVFEFLIEEAHLLKKESSDWDEELYKKSKMNDRIRLLEDNLPQFLVENRQIYSILSSGVHELSEEKCIEIYPDIKLAIELILDEKLHQFEREKKIKSAKAKLSKIHESLKSKTEA